MGGRIGGEEEGRRRGGGRRGEEEGRRRGGGGEEGRRKRREGGEEEGGRRIRRKGDTVTMRLYSVCADCTKPKATLPTNVEVCAHNKGSPCPRLDVRTDYRPGNYNTKLTCGRSKVFSLFIYQM